MLEHADKQLFFQDSVFKKWTIEVYDGNSLYDIIRNDHLLLDELTIEESLCSNDDITLGSCEASSIEFKFFVKQGTNKKYKGKTLKVSVVLDDHTTNPVPIGVYKVDEEALEEDQRIVSIKAYDALYEVLQKDFAPWFNTLNLDKAMTLKDFRDGFMTYAGLEQETVELMNDNILLEFDVSNSSITKNMLDEEDEKIKQARESQEPGNGYKWTLVDQTSYDPAKKTKNSEYKLVTPQAGADPAENEWLRIDKKGNYVLAREHEVETRVLDPVKMAPVGTENPADLGWFEEKKSETGKSYLEETEDTTVDNNKTYYEATRTPVNYYELVETEYFSPAELDWYEVFKGKYTPSRMEKADPLMDYFEKTPLNADELIEEWEDAEIIANKDQNPLELEWWEWNEEDGEYFRSKDTEVDPTKDYYVKITVAKQEPKYAEVIPIANKDQNPKELGWLERSGNDYFPTTDTEVDSTKDYYIESSPEKRSSSFYKLDNTVHIHDNPNKQRWYEWDEEGKAYVRSKDTVVDTEKTYYKNIWDSATEQKDVIQDQILGSDIIQAICEINGCFGHIDRDGIFRYKQLKPIDFDDGGLYPDVELYPDPELYPEGRPFDWEYLRAMYEECEHENYYVQKIDRLTICKEDGDVGYVYPEESGPENHNTYKITGNFIWYSFSGNDDTLKIVGDNIFTLGISQISEYTPCEIKLMGNPCIEVGDTIKVHTRKGVFYTYVLTRTLSGSQRLKDTFRIQGEEKRESDKSIYDAVIALNGKSNILTRDVDQTKSEIIDAAEGLTSVIEQLADSIKLSVTRDVKDLENNLTEKYKAAIEITEDRIKQYVSKKAYSDSMDELEEWKSGITIEYDSISAEVTHTVKETGQGEGFKWTLLSSGFILENLGGYVPQTETATQNMEEVTNVTGKNPSDEWWHEKTDSGQYILTLDTEPKEGKKYYKSVTNPHDDNWYEYKYDETIQDYKPVITDDTCIHEYKTYYRAIPASSWNPVFTCTRNGVDIQGMLKSTNLDVAGLATVPYVRSIDIKTERIRADMVTTDTFEARLAEFEQIITDRLEADYATIGSLSAAGITVGKYIDGHWVGGHIEAGSVSAGEMKSARIDTETLHTEIISCIENIAASTDPYNGKISIGNVACGRMYIWIPIGGTYGQLGDYHELRRKEVTIESKKYTILYVDPTPVKPKNY